MKLLLFICVTYCLLSFSSASDESDPSAGKQGHLKPFGEQGPNVKVGEHNGFLTVQPFFDDYVYKEEPIVMRDAVKDWPAFTKWTDEYLLSKVTKKPTGDVILRKVEGTKATRKESYMHFEDFIRKRNESKDVYMYDHVPDSLKEDIVLPLPLQCDKFKRDKLWRTVMSYSSGVVRGPIYSHNYDPLVCVIRGSQKYVFANFFEYWGIAPVVLTEVEDNAKYSLQDIDVIDLNKTPYWEDVKFHTAELKAGDCIYLIYDWMTQVTSSEDTLAVEIWWIDRSGKPKYKTCQNETTPGWTLDQIVFHNESQIEERDATNILKVFINHKVETYEKMLNFFGNFEQSNSALPADFEDIYPRMVRMLFITADMNKDDKIDSLDLVNRQDNDLGRNFKTFARKLFIKAIDNFNIMVHSMQEKYPDVLKNFKYLFRSRGGSFTRENSLGFLQPVKKEFMLAKDEL